MRTSRRPIFTVLVSPRMGKVVGLIVVVLVAALAATTASARERVAAACADDVIHSGTLTVGTDNPVFTPFARSYAPGKKSFDFDINEISYTPARAKVVSFSSSYYDVNQAVVVRKGTKIANVRTVAGLRGFKLGAQLGTTSYTYIKDKIKPSQQAAVYP